MSKGAISEYVRVPKKEYSQLKKLKKHLADFSLYLQHVVDIKKARNEIQKGSLTAQEEVFKKLGI